MSEAWWPVRVCIDEESYKGRGNSLREAGSSAFDYATTGAQEFLETQARFMEFGYCTILLRKDPQQGYYDLLEVMHRLAKLDAFSAEQFALIDGALRKACADRPILLQFPETAEGWKEPLKVDQPSKRVLILERNQT